MRRFVLAAAMAGMAFGAEAADLPDLPILRGSLPAGSVSRNWDGFYVGGQLSYMALSADFSKSVVGLTNFIFRDSVLQQPTSEFGLLPKTTTQGTGFGGFVGRNWQWDDIVFGVEANYSYFNSLNTKTSGFNSLEIIDPPGQNNPANVRTTYTVTLTGAAAATLKDALAFRARTGWAAGNFLPYVFGAAVVGRMDVSRSVTSIVTRRDDTTDPLTGIVTRGLTLPVPSQSLSLSEQKINQYVAGWSGGLGLEYCVWGGLFMRAEWDYTKILAVKNTELVVNNLRFGLGYKF
jgi:opacity protein-like surface antigen